MSKSRAELINQCLTNLGVIAQGQSISPEETSKMDGIVDPAVAQLADLDIYYVQDAGSLGPSDGAIEDSAFLPLAAYIANEACAAFNLPADAKMQALAQIAEQKLRTLAAPARTRRTLQIDPALRRRFWPRIVNGNFTW
ncbi:hypothetical protein [Bradyrhizobium sp. C9]|uniref:hypothetical protein n=1 Tax=Bradyrhizobium sp. C9 TaxID=142585 RepID=UPI000BE7A14A|nr:hypothetical protein [Bradyrhizobium sp. C9]PDT74124.1 hypothetical protein CO675_27010 [Bradyrhizobium sp. C9]